MAWRKKNPEDPERKIIELEITITMHTWLIIFMIDILIHWLAYWLRQWKRNLKLWLYDVIRAVLLILAW